MTQTATSAQARGFHIAQWGLWGWIETILRVIGLIAGVLALSGPFSGAGITIGGNPRLGSIILLTLVSLPTLPLLLIRLRQREIIALVFAVLNFVGHIALLIALLQIPASLTLALTFGVFHILGFLAKHLFLQSSGYTEAGQSTAGMVRFNFGVLAVYVLFTVALIL